MDFFEFFPGLSKSREVYFGRGAPLAQILITYSQKIKDFFTERDLLKDKLFYPDLLRLTQEFGVKVAKELNIESCLIHIKADKDPNASASLIISFADTCYNYKNSEGEPCVGVDLDKVADLEDIIVGQNGYQFKNKKNKILTVTINHGLFTNELVKAEEAAAIICHEIGHGFQHGIFGVYRVIADIGVSSIVQEKRRSIKLLPDWLPGPIKWLLSFTLVQKLILILFSWLWFPEHMANATGVFSKFGAWIEKKFWGDKVEKPTYKLKEKLAAWDKGDEKAKKALMESPSGEYITKIIAATSEQNNDMSRKKYYDEVKVKEYKDGWKKYVANEKKTAKDHKEATSNFLLNFFRSICIDTNLLHGNIVNVLALNNYTASQYAKVSFYKRYEFFADAFATSYGFGADLFKGLANMNVGTMNELDKQLSIGINRIPMFKALAKTQLMSSIITGSRYDVHGTTQERSRNTYTVLVNELKTNPNLTGDQKKAIQNDIELLIAADEDYYKEMKETGFWYKYYNKLIDQRIAGKLNPDSKKEVLKPIEEVCKASLKN